MKRILFISHDATRTGAPFVLLNFLIWLKRQNQHHITIYLKQGGPLEENFRQIADTFLPKENSLSKRILKKVTQTDAFDSRLPAALLKQKFDLVYINTIVGLDLAPLFKQIFKCPVICHVHENDYTIRNFYPGFLSTENLIAVDHFIAVSKSTSDNLVNNYSVKPADISLVYEFINTTGVKKPGVGIAEVKKELGLAGEFVVGGSGLTIWRKGVDLFMQLAVAVNKLQADNAIKFIWVGELTHQFTCQFEYEAKRLGINGQVIFTGVKQNPQNYFQIFDVFALTSREDPFPLVAIEAASMGKPLLCFDNAGGMTEFITDGENGVVVPYGDVDLMARKILHLAGDGQLSDALGANAQKMVTGFDVEVAAPQLLSIMERSINV